MLLHTFSFYYHFTNSMWEKLSFQQEPFYSSFSLKALWTTFPASLINGYCHVGCSWQWNMRKVCVTSGPRVLEVGCFLYPIFFLSPSGYITRGDGRGQLRKVPKLLCERKETTDQVLLWNIERVKNKLHLGLSHYVFGVLLLILNNTMS